MKAGSADGLDGFEWDEGNRIKCEHHGLTTTDIEHLFRRPFLQVEDAAHSGGEARFRAVGRTPAGRAAFVAFTYRKVDGLTLVRPISARYMHRKEIERYERQALPPPEQ